MHTLWGVVVGMVISAAGGRVYAQDLEAWGMRELQPPVAASAIALKDIKGRPFSLQQERGHYVLLTFFATWCGPCASEMPSLEALYQARKKQGLRILAVGVDSTPEDVDAWVQQKNLSFPVAVDTQGDVAQRYSTGGIPVSFLVSPAGEIVGVAQGAREWASFAQVYDRLTGAQPTHAAASSGKPYQAAEAPVALPPGVKPPSAEVKGPASPVHPNTPFEVQVHITWQGNIQEYVLLPPEVHTPKEVEVLSVQASSSSESGLEHVLYTVACVARKEGSYQLHPVDIRFIPRGSKEPMINRAHGPTLQVQAATSSTRWPWWVGATAAVCALLGVGLVWKRARTRRTSFNTPSPLVAQNTEAHFLSMAQALQNGDALVFLEHARDCAKKLEYADKAVQDIQHMLEKVQYGGYKPASEDLQALQRQLSRLSREKTS
jgi:peroxiredoxin